MLRRRSKLSLQEPFQAVEPPIEASLRGGGSAVPAPCSAIDEQARLQIQELHLLLKGRFEYEDFKCADILREPRRDNVEAHERIDGLEKHATIIHADVLGSLEREQRAADLRYRSATEVLQRIHEETKRGVEDMAGCIQDKVENSLSEFHSVVHTDRRGPRYIPDNFAHRDVAANRVAQLGLVVSSCFASIRSISNCADKLDSMSDELLVLSMQGAEIVRALQAREVVRTL